MVSENMHNFACVCVCGGGGFNLVKLFFGHFHAFHVSVCVCRGGALVAGEGGIQN